MTLQPIYSVPDAPANAEKNATYEKSSPWKNSEISFYWTNFDYPFLHTHQFYETFMIIEGRMSHFINGKKYDMRTGDACIIRPFDEHKLCAYRNESVKTLNFVLRPTFAEMVFHLYDIDVLNNADIRNLHFKLGAIKLKEISDESILIQSLKNNSLTNKVVCTKILYNSVLEEFLKQNILTRKDVPKWIESLLIYLSDPTLSEISIKQDLPSLSNYSYPNMIRIFKKYTGYTVIEYIHLKKIEYATDLLAHSDKQITEIAGLSGYDSLSHFNRLFKRCTGITPREYRKKIKNQAVHLLYGNATKAFE